MGNTGVGVLVGLRCWWCCHFCGTHESSSATTQCSLQWLSANPTTRVAAERRDLALPL